MEKNIVVKRVLEALTQGKTKDYTYLTIFFLVFSIFVFFAIRPSLVTAFSLKKEEADLEQVDAIYDKTIESVVTNQVLLEQMRDKLPLFSSALPDGPSINKVLDDIQKAAAESSIALSNVSIQEVDLVETRSPQVKSFAVQAETGGDFAKITSFLQQVKNQRRLKSIKMVNIGTDVQESSASGDLKIRLEIEGFYL